MSWMAHVRRYRIRTGDMIRRTRKALHLSQMQLAEKVGVSYQQIQKYEKGISEITVSRLYQIAEALGSNPSSFLPPKEIAVAEPLALYGKDVPEEGIQIMTLFNQIKNTKIRESLLTLFRGLIEFERKNFKARAS